MRHVSSIARISDGFYELAGEGWLVWDDAGWSLDRHNWRSILLQPTGFVSAFGDPIAEGCRQYWIEEYHFLLSMPIDYEHLNAVGRWPDISGDHVHALDQIARVPSRGALKQHVSFPALEIGAGVGGVWLSVSSHDVPLAVVAA